MDILVKALRILLLVSLSMEIFASQVLVKDLTRIKGVRENSIVGYGIVTGLAGTGDSSRSKATVKSLGNALQRFGIQLSANEIRSRNVAAVTLTAKLPAYAQEGDVLDINVSSIGDARSLVGGTLLMTELRGPDKKIYAVAQGSLMVGGYKHEINGNSIQKNHPTSAVIPNGATIEKDLLSESIDNNGALILILRTPDIATSVKIAEVINQSFGKEIAIAENAANIAIKFNPGKRAQWLRGLMLVENLLVTPSSSAKVVINERTGTVVYGGNVTLSAVSITHGDIKITVDNETRVYMPNINLSDKSATAIIPDALLEVSENVANQASLPEGSSVTDLILALNKIHASSHDVISILQAIKGAGALHAEVIVQ
ncbi:MAG: flagellar basal body P-ring protein FlgI [Cycloclasticus sp.]|jgi:Flagellar basal-body P-ring protein